MQITKTKIGRRTVYAMDSLEFTLNGVDFLITGTNHAEDGKYYCDVKNLNTGKSKTLEHQRLCLIIIKGQKEEKEVESEPEIVSEHEKEFDGELF